MVPTKQSAADPDILPGPLSCRGREEDEETSPPSPLSREEREPAPPLTAPPESSRPLMGEGASSSTPASGEHDVNPLKWKRCIRCVSRARVKLPH